MTLLAIETSCDETSAAVIRNGEILANVVSSQTRLHEEYGGVVPELATREHLRNLLPVTRDALNVSKVTALDLDAVAATRGPGLPNALMVGLKAAQSLAFALRKPFLGFTITRRTSIRRGFPASRPEPIFPLSSPMCRWSSAADTPCWSTWNRN